MFYGAFTDIYTVLMIQALEVGNADGRPASADGHAGKAGMAFNGIASDASADVLMVGADKRRLIDL